MRGKQPSKLEMAILSLLWERDGMTVRDILDALPDGKQRAYTSVLSVLQAMERKKLVHHTARGNTHVYHAAAAQEPTLRHVLGDMVRDVFGGSPVAAVQHLLSETEVSESELREVERLVAALRERRGGQEEGRS